MKFYERFWYKIFGAINDRWWSVRIFFENVWIFRRELASFRPFDFSYNLAFLARSLEETAKLLDSEKACALGSEERAEEIRSFLDCLEHFESPYSLAEARLGYRHNWELWLEQMDEARKDPEMRDGDFVRMPALNKTEKDRNYWDETDRIEKEMWDRAWEKFSKQARGWWD